MTVAGDWGPITALLDAVVSRVAWGSFVIVEYGRDGGDERPYVQAAPGPAGWYAEVVSQAYLPAAVHPIDEAWLAAAGWLEPDGQTANWWRTAVPTTEIAEVLIAGLRAGRGCADPKACTLRTGRFPDGPPGGEPLPVIAELELLTA